MVFVAVSAAFVAVVRRGRGAAQLRLHLQQQPRRTSRSRVVSTVYGLAVLQDQSISAPGCVDRFIFRDRHTQRVGAGVHRAATSSTPRRPRTSYRALLQDAPHALKLSFGGHPSTRQRRRQLPARRELRTGRPDSEVTPRAPDDELIRGISALARRADVLGQADAADPALVSQRAADVRGAALLPTASVGAIVGLRPQRQRPRPRPRGARAAGARRRQRLDRAHRDRAGPLPRRRRSRARRAPIAPPAAQGHRHIGRPAPGQGEASADGRSPSETPPANT